MDGSNGSTIFTDSSDSAHAITVNGGAVVHTAEKYFGTGALYLPTGTGESAAHLDIRGHADWDSGPNPFAVGCRL